ISSATSAIKFRAPPSNRWIWRSSPRRLPPCGASARPDKDNLAAAAVPAVAGRAVRTDPAAAARGVLPAAARRLAPRIRTLRDPKLPRRILGTPQERATRRQRTPAGAGVTADAGAVPPAAHR